MSEKRHPKQKLVVAEKVQETMDYIRDYCAENGYPPTYREMGEAVGIRSTSTVKLIVDVMLDEGLVTRVHGKTRTLKLVEHDEDTGSEP